MQRLLSGFAFTALVLSATTPSQAAAPDVRMYRLDCGHIRLGDMAVLSDVGLYQGQSQDLVVSCYLIKHGGDWMLWDAGLPKKYLVSPVAEGSSTFKLDRTIVAQLGDLGVRADDIKYVAVSHAHFDHSGQINDFPNATLIIQRSELVAMADTAKATAKGIDALLFSTHITGNKRQRVWVIDGDVDLFGDGTLTTVQTPGHTPGSMALLLRLGKAGAYVLSGDQWHLTENHQRRQVPTWNYDHDQTITSGKKLDDVIAANHATLVIQHEPADNQKLPTLPGFLD